MIAELDRLGKVVHLVEVFPFDPHVFHPDVTLITGFPHHPEDARVVDGVLLE